MPHSTLHGPGEWPPPFNESPHSAVQNNHFPSKYHAVHFTVPIRPLPDPFCSIPAASQLFIHIFKQNRRSGVIFVSDSSNTLNPRMEEKFINSLYREHQESRYLPPPEKVCSLFHRHLEMLFPEFSSDSFHSLKGFEIQWNKLKQDYIRLFQKLDLPEKPVKIAKKFFDQIPEVKHRLELDAQAILTGDPAAVDIYEVKRTYPGFLAIAYYRFAHLMDELGIPYCPRILTEDAHSRTGIDIHPKARIGLHFCIDHGTGVVIGETSVIGDHVKIYQGVTLGALSVDKEMASLKRHPTIEDNVVIYSGATILGGDTIIGASSVIGGNVWLTKSVRPNSKIYYQPTTSELNEI